jgi:hypothetical protein
VRLNRVTRIAVVEHGGSHFSTAERNDFSVMAIIFSFSFNRCPVGSHVPVSLAMTHPRYDDVGCCA